MEEQERLAARKALLSQYIKKIQAIPKKDIAYCPARKGEHYVLLTGSTGTIASHILHKLVQDSAVVGIFCLNRATNSELLQGSRSRTQGLPILPEYQQKVSFFTANLSQPHFGLPAEEYDQLQSKTTVIIHTAWPVNFNFSTSIFEPHLQGIVNLIAFAHSVPSGGHFVFTSSIGAVYGCQFADAEVAETIVESDVAPASSGYGESKYIGEHLIDNAAKHLNLPCTIARVGQVAGSVDYEGLWNKNEWLPRMVLSSLRVGAFPSALGASLSRVRWIPVDAMASIFLEIALEEDPMQSWRLKTGEPAVFHFINPQSVGETEVLSTIQSEIAQAAGKEIRGVSLGEWLDLVRNDARATIGRSGRLDARAQEAYLEINPAIKLVDFYGQLVPGNARHQETPSKGFDMRLSIERSKKLRDLEAIRAEWVRKWVREWLAATEKSRQDAKAAKL